MSQTEFAKMIGISRATYSGYELGNRVPDAEVLFKIASSFGMNMNIFFECDKYRFLSYIENCTIYDHELAKLVAYYRNLSSFARGMLVERAASLKDWDKMIESNKQALAKKMLESYK